MSECSHDCGSCSSQGSCSDVMKKETMQEGSSVKKIIGVVSGKGGVGKSFVTSMLAVGMRRRGAAVGVLDADITGPSIPNAFRIREKAKGTETELIPVESGTGIKVMSINLLLENESDPVVWRGPVLGGVIKQFFGETRWGDLDYLFVDMPPGTGDVPLTVYQSLPLDGIVVVMTPQDLVSMIVEKAVKMAEMLNIPVLGLVENMSYFVCDKCEAKHEIFGKSNLNEVAEICDVQTVVRLPLSEDFAKKTDAGEVETVETDLFDNLLDSLSL